MPTTLPSAFYDASRPRVKPQPVASLYRPGMTQQQFQSVLAADPAYRAILHDPANRAPNGQLTPQGWIKANQYAGSAGLYDLNATTRNDVAGAFHGGGSRYAVGSNGEVTEQHDGWWNPETAGTLLGIGLGIYGGGSALGYFGGAGSATASTVGPSTAANIAGTSAVANSAPAGIAATGGATVVPPAVTTGGFTARNFLTSPAGGQIIGAGIGAGTTIYAANKQASSNREAAELEAAAKDKELAYLREKDRQDQLNWERTQQFNIDQYNQRLDRLSPYIGMGTSANATLANLIGGPSMVAATQQPLPHASLPPQAGSPSTGATSSLDLQTASQKFLSAVQQAGLNPVAVQGHGRVIADAVNRIAPDLNLSVDPQSDAIVWNGIPIDVTIDSGKGGWSFRPAGAGVSTGALPRTTASSLFGLPATLAALNTDTSAPMQTPRIGVDRSTPTANNFLRVAA